ncbi:hypothetical protein MNBD_CPR01-115 [hydrothermal vent metagenome]|uniref:Uncharacterized protein n=1 Tax=hydrothermal vent metagenome TaxID=652676 RepID=A0A3B0VL87_9ZZZZ
MKTREAKVKEFHKVFGIEISVTPTARLLKSRRALIAEETQELIEALDNAITYMEKGKSVPDCVYENMLKEMSDVQISLSGLSVSVKPVRNFEEAFNRVHKSNMSKLGDDGNIIRREDGKILKGPSYKEPDLSDLI